MAVEDFGSIWQAKIRTLQTRLDLDEDGQVTWGDFEEMSQRFGTIGNATPEQVEKIRNILRTMYDQYLAPVIAVGPLTGDAYVAALMAKGKAAISETVHEIYSAFFDVINTSDSGRISAQELQVYYKVMGIDASYADAAFIDMDADGIGSVSKADYLREIDNFFCSEKTSNLWGPLVD